MNCRIRALATVIIFLLLSSTLIGCSQSGDNPKNLQTEDGDKIVTATTEMETGTNSPKESVLGNCYSSTGISPPNNERLLLQPVSDHDLFLAAKAAFLEMCDGTDRDLITVINRFSYSGTDRQYLRLLVEPVNSEDGVLNAYLNKEEGRWVCLAIGNQDVVYPELFNGAVQVSTGKSIIYDFRENRMFVSGKRVPSHKDKQG